MEHAGPSMKRLHYELYKAKLFATKTRSFASHAQASFVIDK
jgi:hypothetical protein